ncbi:hypothetical protein B0H17DRAFT_1134136 [Mycena rosella]|uniref:Uncharacterized protein n=1 Tax=Mycena rosella TaxID=1033263 RepID=A0AAD7GJI0_MYCRO|nr:hypothetical protein B0H17DRAFT_1134136 [Mycena rosella]
MESFTAWAAPHSRCRSIDTLIRNSRSNGSDERQQKRLYVPVCRCHGIFVDQGTGGGKWGVLPSSLRESRGLPEMVVECARSGASQCGWTGLGVDFRRAAARMVDAWEEGLDGAGLQLMLMGRVQLSTHSQAAREKDLATRRRKTSQSRPGGSINIDGDVVKRPKGKLNFKFRCAEFWDTVDLESKDTWWDQVLSV